jgi:MFS transporter, FHS family, L-fucose permease
MLIRLATGAAADAYGTGISMFVPLIFFIAAWSYAFAVNFVPSYRDPVDAFHITEIGLHGHHDGVVDEGTGTRESSDKPAVELVNRHKDGQAEV